jgi:hypothetical protein
MARIVTFPPILRRPAPEIDIFTSRLDDRRIDLGEQTVAQALSPFPNYKSITDTYGNLSYLNANAFVPISTLTGANSPYAYTFGNAARTAPFGMYGPGNYDIDISLRRSFGLPFESSRITLEGDLYNLTNHTQLSVGGLLLADRASARSAVRPTVRVMLSCRCA